MRFHWATFLAFLGTLALGCPEFGELSGRGYYGDPTFEGPTTPNYDVVPKADILEAAASLKRLASQQNPRFSAPPVLSGLRRNAPEVTAIGPNIAHSGVQNFGVFRVSTPEGPLALKFSSAHTARDLRYSFLVQQLLSVMDLAPRIEGIYDGASLRKLMKQHNFEEKLAAQQREGEPLVGIAMEEIAGGWNFRINHELPPGWAAKLDREAVVAQIRQIGQVLDVMGVKAVDPQFMITPDSKVRLIDLDLFLVRGKNRWLGKREDPGLEIQSGNDFNDIVNKFHRVHQNLQNENRHRRPLPGT